MPIQCLTKECHISVGSDFRSEAEIIHITTIRIISVWQVLSSWHISANVFWSCWRQPTCSGLADEIDLLVKHDNDVEFPQMVNDLFFLATGFNPLMWCVAPECSTEQTLAYFMCDTEKKKNMVDDSWCASESWMKGHWKLCSHSWHLVHVILVQKNISRFLSVPSLNRGQNI